MSRLAQPNYVIRFDGSLACPVNPASSWLHAQTKPGNWGRALT